MSHSRADGLVPAILSACNTGIIGINRDETVMAVNHAMERVLSLDARQITGRPLREVAHCRELTGALAETLKRGQAAVDIPVFVNGQEFVLSTVPVIQMDYLTGVLGRLDTGASNRTRIVRDRLNLLESALEGIYDGIVVIDRDCRVIFFNRSYSNFLGLRQEEVLGRPVWDVIENTRMHIVLRTGRAEIGQVQRIKGHDMICSRIPLMRGKKVWAAAGMVMFKDVEELRLLMHRVDRLKSELEYYRGELIRHQGARYNLEDIVGNSMRMLELKELTKKLANTCSTVLIRGESGTGKELFAHALHSASPRYTMPFVRLNCAALPENLLESELFGYREGAFTGARKGGKRGKFEEASGGSLFLDEIGELSLNMQAKILRVLQEREIERLGDNHPVEVDVRLISATSRNLEDLVRNGTFREDLYYRLNVVILDIPPLRERLDDIPLLVEHLFKRLSHKLGLPLKIIHPAVLEYLGACHWPGNVRELENMLERLLNISSQKEISLSDLPVKSLKKAREELEITMIRRALEAAEGNRAVAAKMLSISKSSLYGKLSEYGIR